MNSRGSLWRSKRWERRWLALLMAGLLTGACDQADPEQGTPNNSEKPEKPVVRNLLLITLDTTRADRLGPYGYESGHLPWIQSLAEQGLVYEKAYAPTPITLPSHCSLLSGTFSNAHGVRDNGIFRLAEEALLVPEVLQSHQFQTAAAVGAVVLDPKYGTAQGFDEYFSPDAPALVFAGHIPERRGEEVIADAKKWLESVDRDRPFFFWLHLYDPHAPYEAPKEFSDTIDDPYDAELAYCDHLLADLMQFLGDKNLDDDLGIVLSADHGESLGEHGEDGHGVFLYDATQWVPLIISIPGLEASRKPDPVPTAAIAPTLLDMVGIDPAALDESPCRSLLDPEYGSQPNFLESLLPFYMCRWHPIRGWVKGDDKLLEATYFELYDTAQDPRESSNLADEDQELVKKLKSEMDRYLQQWPSLGWSEQLSVSASDREALEALGYVVGSGEDGEEIDPFDQDLRHPIERIDDLRNRKEAARLTEEARQHLAIAQRGPVPQRPEAQRDADRKFDQASALLTGILDANPLDPSSNASLGTLEVYRGRYRDAIGPLEKALSVLPSIPNLRFNLAICYLQDGRQEWAILEMEKVLTCEPGLPSAYQFLMDLMTRESRFGEAWFWAEQAAKNCPDIPEIDQRIKELKSQASRLGQSKTAPSEFPVEQLLPEGLKDEKGS